MTKENIIEMLEEIMELDEGELNETTELAEVEEWDSIAKLALMAQVKKSFGKNLTVEEMKKFATVQDICELLLQ